MRVMQVNRLSPTEFEEVEVSEIWPIKRTDSACGAQTSEYR